MRTLLLAAAVAAAPLPATAGAPSPQPLKAAGIHATGQAIVAAQVLAAPALPAAARSAAAAQTDLGSRSFFKTPAGVITLVAMAAGVGFALYSTKSDRVKSPAR